MKSLNNLKTIVNQQPTSAGIYKMINAKDQILYVGKAKNIKNRLKSYLNHNNLSNRIKRLVAQIKKIDVVITETEKEALLLEANLIKKLKPQFNILLRDDKSFPYIFINYEQDYPQISKHRGKQKKNGVCGLNKCPILTGDTLIQFGLEMGELKIYQKLVKY